ncbi:MAG: Ketose-bisphosphate aldolase, class-II [Candidatus Nomurabacteria bacterium GW2011_GWF2_43_8]|uniref:Ketose-bisphosphate aldolase, class-II n=3 Tax=Candidatus Nomuraibacteriota TaxID=1752729 RepID=A0A0G1HXQ7_9BACT|nr:MAG: Ketose-bisphosphate aldolase, class-II [Candidatus Nomurabacteria bacterium GW2011_GWA2_43_15]KKT18658.1 MAG: Ketose-bisphosphate aldolase, class-II [Candidatus Nomurabacteria bacterium GW2011_GWB1_43_7]KKT24422.1 MAG: Ketose-bisphosphate aldolase, class-II [Candidatus Nomurabacteria bacterium GW2011_GWF2_43_8]
MKTYGECIKEANEKGIAIGHFNISNLETLHAIYNAAKKLQVPIIIGLTENESEFFGRTEAVAVIRALRSRDNYPIFLNGDHHYSLEAAKTSIDAGYDSVVIDLVKLPFEENIRITKECVDYARQVAKKEKREILVEAELGFIGTGSKILDKLPDGVSEATMTTPEDAKRFVAATGVDLLAPSIGNVHGMVKSGNPRLHPERVKAIRAATGIPLVLHGGSGSMSEDFIACIKEGIDIVHINTEIRVAFTEALKKSLTNLPEEITPYKYLPPTVEAVQTVVEARLKLFSGMK